MTPDPDDPRYVRARRRHIDEAEHLALREIRSLDREGTGYLPPDRLLEFGPKTGGFDRTLERTAVARGWFREPPGQAIWRWRLIGLLELFVAGAVFFLALALPSDGLTLMGLGLAITGLMTLPGARVMPARTMAGAMIFAMLAAYRRTLQKTLDQARSMTQVIESRILPWLETPDQAVVWGVALGLHDNVQRVIARSVEDLRAGRGESTGAWVPSWYSGSSGSSESSGSGASGQLAPGLLAASAIPNVGGMFAAIGTIGNSPSPSGDGGGDGGGFGGGSSGGGGGGAGGGF